MKWKMHLLSLTKLLTPNIGKQEIPKIITKLFGLNSISKTLPLIPQKKFSWKDLI